MLPTMGAEYHLTCTACSLNIIVEGVNQTLDKQEEHKSRHGHEHYIEFERVDEPTILSPNS